MPKVGDMSVCVCLSQAYSLVDREVGYCQGSAFIVGLLLMQVSFQIFFFPSFYFTFKIE